MTTASSQCHEDDTWTDGDVAILDDMPSEETEDIRVCYNNPETNARSQDTQPVPEGQSDRADTWASKEYNMSSEEAMSMSVRHGRFYQ